MNRILIFWTKIIVISTILTVLGGCMAMMGMHDTMHEQMHGGHSAGEPAQGKEKTESQGGHSH